MWETIKTKGLWVGEIYNQRKNTEIYPARLSITQVTDTDNIVTNYVSTLIDITENKMAETKIHRLAFYDPLTNLPNRRLLYDLLKPALAASKRSGRKGALLFIDLDDFKTLNDTLGHDMGDLLLIQVATRLLYCVRECDTVARLGGDEFVVMLDDLSEQSLVAAAKAEDIGQKILAILNQCYQLKDRHYHCSASIGAIIFNEHEISADELLKQADIAMYQAKSSGRNTLRFFDPEMQVSIDARAELEANLREALSAHHFSLYYQAQVNNLMQITGAEALIRWQHPTLGFISPMAFIPLAESTGLILPIGRWVLETACAQLQCWATDERTEPLQLAVNISRRQFYEADFVAQVRQLLTDTQINPARLKLELTESLVLKDLDDARDKMHELRQLGVGFSMDDFGTGYSSLSNLKHLPFDQLKIDQSFINDLGVNTDDAIIVKTIIVMAKSMNMEVIAEGVETEAQRQFLSKHDCQLYQGYLFSKPVPIEQFALLL
jgi:diguanylate cyclase (GGDEF)-like protein